MHWLNIFAKFSVTERTTGYEAVKNSNNCIDLSLWLRATPHPGSLWGETIIVCDCCYIIVWCFVSVQNWKKLFLNPGNNQRSLIDEFQYSLKFQLLIDASVSHEVINTITFIVCRSLDAWQLNRCLKKFTTFRRFRLLHFLIIKFSATSIKCIL